MSVLIRNATIDDLPAMVELLLEDARQRQSSVPSLWPVAPDAAARTEAAIRAGLDGSHLPRELWQLAEDSGRVVGVTHSMVVPVPPIYGIRTGPPGLLLDDCFVAAAHAPPETAEMLLAATAVALREAGAGSLIGSCPIVWCNCDGLAIVISGEPGLVRPPCLAG